MVKKLKKKRAGDETGSTINIKAIERRLPPKKPRSHNILIKFKNIHKSFPVGKQTIEVLKGINLNFYSGEFAIIYGPSGCGKSTLLHLLLGLEPPTKGRVYLRGQNIYTLKPDQRTNFRRKKLGMVFQQSNWIKSLSVWQNVAYPLWLDGQSEAAAKQQAGEALAEVEMSEFARYHPLELSGGQQQRVALARAIVTNPYILVADEPTGNLDSRSSAEIITLLTKLNRLKRRMILMVTHNTSFLSFATRRVGMRDGLIVKDENDD